MDWLSVTELSEQLDIPAETIRRYINRHEMHLYVKKESKSYYVSSTSIAVIEKIRQLYSEGKQKEEVARALDLQGVPINRIENVEVRDINDESWMISLQEKLNVMASVLVNIDERLKQHEAFKDVVADELNHVRVELNSTREQIAATTDHMMNQMFTIEESVNRNHHILDGKIEHALSRVETYKQEKKSWWKRGKMKDRK